MFEMLSFMNVVNIKICVNTERETIFAIRSHYNIINKNIYYVCVCTVPIKLFIIFFMFYVAALCETSLNCFPPHQSTLHTP